MAEYEKVLRAGRVVKCDKRWNAVMLTVKHGGRREFVYVPCDFTSTSVKEVAGQLYRDGLFSPCDEYDVMYLDVETRGSVDVATVPQPVLSAVFYSTKDSMWHIMMYIKDACTAPTEARVAGAVQDKYGISPEVRCYPDELVFLEGLALQIAGHDVIAGWNSKFFDLPYLAARITKLGGDMGILSPVHRVRIREGAVSNMTFGDKKTICDIMGVSQVDLVAMAEKQTQWFLERPESLALGAVADMVMGESKLKLEEPVPTLWDSGQYVKLALYNFQDTWITYGIDQKLSLIDYCTNIRKIVPTVNLDYSEKYATIYEFYIACFYPDAPLKSEEEQPLVGGFTMDPVQGLHTNVVVFDFAGLYPNLIRQFNISPDSFLADSTGGNASGTGSPAGVLSVGGRDEHTGKVYSFKTSSSKKGYLTEIVDKFAAMRADYKAKMKADEKDYRKYYLLQLASKTLLNSAFGVYGFKFFSHYSPSVVNAVTTTGQGLIRAVIAALEQGGFRVIYGDTDSVFVSVGSLDRVGEALGLGREAVDKFCEQHGSKNNCLELEHETTWDVLLLSKAKKKYIGLCSLVKGKPENSRLYYKGIEIVKKDTPKALRPILKDCIRELLSSKDLSSANLRKLVAEAKGKISRLSEKDFIVYKAISKPFDEYKVMPQHVRAAVWMNEAFKTNFSKQNYSGGIVYIKDYKGSTCAFVSESELRLLGTIIFVDRAKYADMFVVKKLSLLLDKDVEKMCSTSSLAEFWGNKHEHS